MFCVCFPICTAVIVDDCGGEAAQHILLSLFWAKGGILGLEAAVISAGHFH